MQEIVDAINEIIEGRVMEILASYGIKDCDEDKLNMVADSLPYIVYYDKKRIMELVGLIIDEQDQWQMQVVEYLKENTENHLITIELKDLRSEFNFVKN